MTATARRTQPAAEEQAPEPPSEPARPARVRWHPHPDNTVGCVLIAVELGLAYTAGALFTFWYLDDPASGA